MARISGVDLPREKRVEIGLTYIYGIGRVSSNKILAKANINPDTRVKDLTDEELSILSVSYGLSVPQMREPEMTPLAKLFEHIKMVSEGHNQYEHGISDVE